MAEPRSLAEFLGIAPSGALPEAVPNDLEPVDYEKLTGKDFAEAVLNSRDFKRYVVNMLSLGELSSAIIVRLMDYAWGKPAERVEHTGKDGEPIVTEVRRVIVRVGERGQIEEIETPKYTTH